MVDILGITDMIGVVAVDERKRWNGNGGTVRYGSMIMEKIISLSVIDDDRYVGNDDVKEEGRCSLVVVVAVAQQHRGDDHHKEIVPTNTFLEEERIAVACLSDAHRILFLFRDHNSLIVCMIGF